MILFNGFVSILSLMIFIRCKYTYFCWDILWFWWWIFIWPATYLIFLSIVCNFATFFGLDTQNAEKNRLTDFLVAPKGAKRFWISYYTISQYRTIRFWISYYTILDIVLYDFAISYYTILDIVLYDLTNRNCGCQKTADGVGRGFLLDGNHPDDDSRAMSVNFLRGDKCHTCGCGDVLPGFGLALCVTFWYWKK